MGARPRDVREPSFLLERTSWVVRLLDAPPAREPSLVHPDDGHVVELEALGAVGGREQQWRVVAADGGTAGACLGDRCDECRCVAMSGRPREQRRGRSAPFADPRSSSRGRSRSSSAECADTRRLVGGRSRGVAQRFEQVVDRGVVEQEAVLGRPVGDPRPRARRPRTGRARRWCGQGWLVTAPCGARHSRSRRRARATSSPGSGRRNSRPLAEGAARMVLANRSRLRSTRRTARSTTRGGQR